MTGTLYVVPVPIGNIGDITLRAVEVLRAVDLVAAEDTRHFRTLARALSIDPPVISLHEHNEAVRAPQLITRLTDGASVALVTDAGTPLVSDPGFRLLTGAIDAGIRVTSLPGASAVTTALAASGLAPLPFRFCGYPPRAAGPRHAFYLALRGETATMVLFEAPHRLVASLRDAIDGLGDRRACLARNMTKPHERYQRGTLGKLIAALSAEETVRGECTLVIAGLERRPSGTSSDAAKTEAESAAAVLLREGAPPRAVQALLTERFGLSRRQAYRLAHGVSDLSGEKSSSAQD
jgi:16S rRNA (cytidine1402-2'-O)-methyltransferase